MSGAPHPLLLEYLAAREKIDAAVRAIAERRAGDLACKKGCASCCTVGLTVLSVEAFAIQKHLDARGLAQRPSPPEGGCAFLDEGGACTIYDVRPVLCRTHGIPLRMANAERKPARPGALRVLDGDAGVEVCALNFQERPPRKEDVLDAERIAALLLVVEQRFRERAGLEGPIERVPLVALVP